MKRNFRIAIIFMIFLVGCTPKAYTTNVSSGIQHLENLDFNKAIQSFEKAKEEKETEEIEELIMVSSFLYESEDAFNKGDLELSREKLNFALEYKVEYDSIKNAISSANQLLEQLELVSEEKKALEESIAKGVLLLEQQKFDEAETVFVEEVINKEKKNKHIVITDLVSESFELREETLQAKAKFEQDLLAKKEAEEKAKKEAEERAQKEAEEREKEASNALPVSNAEQAIHIVKNHLNNNSPELHYEVGWQESNGDYIIQVYQIITYDTGEGHTSTYGWYGVKSQTGQVYDAMGF